jgi:hypothetical protein
MTKFPTIDPRGLFGSAAFGSSVKAAMEHETRRIRTPWATLDAQVSAYIREREYTPDLSGVRQMFMNNLRRQLNKHPRHWTSSADRTNSSRRRAGMRRGNGGATVYSDYWINHGHAG